MPQSLARVLVHLVFSTKNRAPTIAQDIRPEVHAYLGGILDKLGCSPLRVGVTAEHVHILFSLSRGPALSQTPRKRPRRGASKWMKQARPDFW